MTGNKSQNLAAVVIPVYRSTLSRYQWIALEQCCKILGHYFIFLVGPLTLNMDIYQDFHPGFLIELFDDVYFKDIQGYNRLMLSTEFYERFLSYQFILVYQLDAFVFSDQLSYWCKKGYDYIGAPWLKEMEYKNLKARISFLYDQYKAYKTNRKEETSNLPDYIQFTNKVGNGGFSLRRVKKMYQVCSNQKELIEFYNSQEHHFYNEDVFWGLEVNRRQKVLNIPPCKKANLFSFEQYPEYAMRLSRGQMPFGCHDWDGYTDFWRGIFRKYGYEI